MQKRSLPVPQQGVRCYKLRYKVPGPTIKCRRSSSISGTHCGRFEAQSGGLLSVGRRKRRFPKHRHRKSIRKFDKVLIEFVCDVFRLTYIVQAALVFVFPVFAPDMVKVTSVTPRLCPWNSNDHALPGTSAIGRDECNGFATSSTTAGHITSSPEPRSRLLLPTANMLNIWRPNTQVFSQQDGKRAGGIRAPTTNIQSYLNYIRSRLKAQIIYLNTYSPSLTGKKHVK